MRSEVEARIMEAAIELFAERGYSAGARDIAEKARTTTMTIYRSFHSSKEYLFEEALREVIDRSFDPGKFALFIYKDQKSQDLGGVLLSALQGWYAAMQPSSARLLAYAYLSSNKKWREMADAAMEKIMAILATTIERQMTRTAKQKPDARAAAKALIALLFEMKMTRSRGRLSQPDNEEAGEVKSLLHYLLQPLA